MQQRHYHFVYRQSRDRLTSNKGRSGNVWKEIKVCLRFSGDVCQRQTPYQSFYWLFREELDLYHVQRVFEYLRYSLSFSVVFLFKLTLSFRKILMFLRIEASWLDFYKQYVKYNFIKQKLNNLFRKAYCYKSYFVLLRMSLTCIKLQCVYFSISSNGREKTGVKWYKQHWQYSFMDSSNERKRLKTESESNKDVERKSKN